MSNSVLTSRSFARNRFEIVNRRNPNRPSLVFPQICVNPRKSNVSGLPDPVPPELDQHGLGVALLE